MNTLLIGYDLNKTGQDYEDVIDAIKGLGGTWWHHLDSTWIVKTTETASSARDQLVQHLDGNDEILVVNITGDAAAWDGFNAAGSKWLKDNL